MTKLDLSVIMPTKRYGPVIPILFSGLKNQTLEKESWEVIIIDDVPESREKEAEAHAEKHGITLQYVHPAKKPYWKSNRNIANARNHGLMLAKGSLIVFVDDYTWVPPRFLESHLDTYDVGGYCLIGAVTAVQWTDNPPEDFRTLPVQDIDKRAILKGGIRPEGAIDSRTLQGYTEFRGCQGAWFYCSNASAPLDKIIEANGFWEIADCTSEEDLILGMMLQRLGCKFWFKSNPDVNACHMAHGKPEMNPKKIYPEEGCFRVIPDIFKTKNEGSWALLEVFNRNPNLRFNAEMGFDLRKEREKLENLHVSS